MITSTLVLTSVGDDTGVILPADVLEKLGVEPDGSLNVSETSRGFELTACHETFSEQVHHAAEIMHENTVVLMRLAK